MADTPDLRALVTGASSGIGAAYARALRARGDRVVLVARRGDRLRSLADELGGEPHALVLPLDLAGPGAAEALRGDVEARGIAIDCLVNCAGLGHTAPFEAQRPEAIRAMLDVNVRALVELTRAFLPGMRGRARGRIVNVASIGALRPLARLGPYCASKAGLVQLTRVMAVELARHNVQVNAVCPGYFATPMNEAFFATAKGQEMIQRSIPMRRLGEPAELGPTVVFLASEASSFMTGSVVVVDGGQTLT